MNSFAPVSKKLKTIYLFMLLFSLAATGVTILLIFAHYDVGGGIGGACNLNDYWSCDRVNTSSFAELYGVPVAILGLIYYFILALFSLGLLLGFDYNKKLGPLTPRRMLHIGVVGAVLVAVGMAIVEIPLPGAIDAVAIIKAVLFIIAYTIIYKYSLKFPGSRTEFLGALSLYTVFGVGFSLYLTNIELFVLEAICIYCLTQQFLILIITALNIYALKTSSHD